MPSGAQPNASTRALWILPLAALLAILPLLLHGCSCGQDLTFHVQSWLDAAQQLRHGTLYPRWAFTPAWNAGEPRFLFYPPLSWMFGAILTIIFPVAAAPTIYIFIALLASGLTFYKLASHFVAPNAALLAAALYLSNPYMLFNAFERSALAELLAAAWIPLLLLAVLRTRPTIRAIAIPIALLWLTNAPAAVMGCYTLALLATLRVLTTILTRHEPHASQTPSSRPEHMRSLTANVRSGETPVSAPRLALTYIAGTALGLALPAFYLIPAACERGSIQVAMAIIPNMRYQDNFLFTRTTDAAHNVVNHTASALALTLLLFTIAAVLALLLLRKRIAHASGLPNSTGLPTASGLPSSAVLPNASVLPNSAFLSVLPEGREPQRAVIARWSRGNLLLALPMLTAIIAFLLFPISTPIWQHLPELAFLQFPWRLLTILSAILALTLALLLDAFTHPHKIHLPPSAQDTQTIQLPQDPRKIHLSPSAQDLDLVLPLALTLLCFHLYAQPCEPDDHPATIAQHLATHHGVAPTDEYTPTHADNDVLRTDNPGYWLLPPTADPNTPAPNTLPTASELNPNVQTDDNPIPLDQTLSAHAPTHLTLNLTQPETLVLNLRDYPNWRITRTTPTTTTPKLSPSAQDSTQDDRDDGLLAIALPAGPSTIDIAWHRTPDQTLGLALSALALIALALTFRRKLT